MPVKSNSDKKIRPPLTVMLSHLKINPKAPTIMSNNHEIAPPATIESSLPTTNNTDSTISLNSAPPPPISIQQPSSDKYNSTINLNPPPPPPTSSDRNDTTMEILEIGTAARPSQVITNKPYKPKSPPFKNMYYNSKLAQNRFRQRPSIYSRVRIISSGRVENLMVPKKFGRIEPLMEKKIDGPIPLNFIKFPHGPPPPVPAPQRKPIFPHFPYAFI